MPKYPTKCAISFMSQALLLMQVCTAATADADGCSNAYGSDARALAHGAHERITQGLSLLAIRSPLIRFPGVSEESQVEKSQEDSSERAVMPTDWVSRELNTATCVEGVLVEPRAIHYTTVALESAVGVAGVNLLTLAHGKTNGQWAENLVVSSNILNTEHEKGTLRLLSLPVQDLGGNDPVNEMPSLMNWGAGYHDEYSRLMTTPGFWRLFKCDTILLFQSDCVFCQNTKVSLSEFLQYPYVGGITPGFDAGPTRHHLNGGFSLRKRPEMLKCLAEEPDQIEGRTEDDFYSRCKTLAQPPVSVANRFAIDNAHTLLAEAPLGVHKPWGNGPFHEQVMHLCKGAEKLFNAMTREKGSLLEK